MAQIGSDLDNKSLLAKSVHFTDNSIVEVGKVDEFPEKYIYLVFILI